ncbi:ABC-F family ATP-binding cassette domain-containing protein [Flaviflagellibacter deserti]|uniref:ABC-F family ATP-binding cassette domain-containing protein n=1 Tax=Flaviflagellibacter deserti TaxID=2267266 RepID=A0ABV9YZW7_9HYPH
MLQVNDLTLRIAGRTLLDNASAMIPEGARVGIVGRNGTGKTTFFKAIAGDIGPDDGTLKLPKAARFGRVAQEAPSGPDSLLDRVLAADTERTALLAEAETATDPGRIADIQIRLVDIDAHSAPSRAARILAGLGFDADAQQRPCASFSGGWRMRVALAAVLFSEPDLLLLDEPTNHLDLEGTLWLQDYLARYPRTVLVISHDRDLLDASVDHILHLDGGKLVLYRGNFTSFDRQRREKLALDIKAKKKQDEERARLEAFVARFKAKASKASQAQSRVKRLEKMETISVRIENDVPPFIIPPFEKPLAPPILALDRVSIGYGERVILKNLALSLAPDARIALLGANGNGKSTLSKLFAGELGPMAGEAHRSSKLKIGYFAQHTVEGLNLDETPYQHIRERMPDAPDAKVRARTAQIGFSAQRADVQVNRLSGGEKARLAMGLAVFEAPHLLILDEPTNHLDIDSRAALVDALNEYEGAVILVSHDRHLLDACADELWLVANGTVKPFDGSLEDYQKLILKTARGDGEGKARKQEPAADCQAELAPLRARIRDLEAQVSKLETDIGKIDDELAAGTANPLRAGQLAKKRAEFATKLMQAEEDWLAAGAELEKAMA